MAIELVKKSGSLTLSKPTSGGTGTGGDTIYNLGLNGTVLTIATDKGNFDIDLAPIFDTRNFVYYSDGEAAVGIELIGSALYIRSGVAVSQSGSALTIGG